MSTRPSMQGRTVCFAKADWQAFGDLLAAAFPYARYYCRDTEYHGYPPEGRTPEPPQVVLADHLMRTGAPDRFQITGVFVPGYRIEHRRVVDYDDPEQWRWVIAPAPIPNIYFRLKSEERVDDNGIAGLSCTEIVFRAEHGNRDHARMRGQVFRMIAKLSVKRQELAWGMVAEGPSDFTVPANWANWCGRHAVEWTRGHPRRALDYSITGVGLRALETGDPAPAPAGKARRKP